MKEKKKMPLTEAEMREVGAKYHAKLRKQKDETKTIIITPRKLRLLKLGLKERTKIRRRKEEERRQQYFK